MSYHACEEASCADAADSAVETVITPKPKDLGGFTVRRALPALERRRLGPFVFFDQMGPAGFPAGQGIDVRPHPHIGLATLTWLIQGEILHRDSLGSEQVIQPGAVNWMIAGSGIVHSERTPDDARAAGAPLYGLQTWLALPQSHEEMDPSFTHHPADSLPRFSEPGCEIVLIAGRGWGKQSPVRMLSDTHYADVRLQAGGTAEVPGDIQESGVYVLSGEVTVDGTAVAPGRMAVLAEGDGVPVRAATTAHVMFVGGAALDGHRHLWWNFVSSSKDRIDQAKEDWAAGRFTPVPGETEFIPLPER